jgi:hypothetical protein
VVDTLICVCDTCLGLPSHLCTITSRGKPTSPCWPRWPQHLAAGRLLDSHWHIARPAKAARGLATAWPHRLPRRTPLRPERICHHGCCCAVLLWHLGSTSRCYGSHHLVSRLRAAPLPRCPSTSCTVMRLLPRVIARRIRALALVPLAPAHAIVPLQCTAIVIGRTWPAFLRWSLAVTPLQLGSWWVTGAYHHLYHSFIS